MRSCACKHHMIVCTLLHEDLHNTKQVSTRSHDVTRVRIYLLTRLSVYLSTYASVRPSVRGSASLSIYLSRVRRLRVLMIGIWVGPIIVVFMFMGIIITIIVTSIIIMLLIIVVLLCKARI